MTRLFLIPVVLGLLSACAGASSITSALLPMTPGDPLPVNASDAQKPTDEEKGDGGDTADAAEEEDDVDTTDYLVALGGLLVKARSEMEDDEWRAFLKEVGISEDMASLMMGLVEDEAKVDLSLTDHMPIVDLDATVNRYKRTFTGIRHIGADVAPLPAGTSCGGSGEDPVPNARWCDDPLPNHALSSVGDHGGVAVSHGRIKDGVGRDQVVAWLKEAAIVGQERGVGGLPIHPEPLTLKIIKGASDEQTGWVVEAVRIINAALPHGRKITISDEPAPVSPIPTFWSLPEGEIHVRFDSGHNHTYWPMIDTREGNDGRSHIGGIVWMNPNIWPYGRAALAYGEEFELDRKQSAVGIIVHELFHATGFLVHPDMVSILSYSRELKGYAGLPGHVVYPLDREGLLAAYTRLNPGVAPEDIDEDLGPWSDTSIHVRGVLGLSDEGELAFGAAHRNGFVQPWAYGPSPDMDLADNPALSGSANWEGRLLGLTPDAEVVAGAADMTIRLATLDGTLDFIGLESWTANAAPGAIGTGNLWGDGDLGYSIAVKGNTFVQTGGDEGTVTGAFFGAAHEAMGGTLERNDLAAGFGGKR